VHQTGVDLFVTGHDGHELPADNGPEHVHGHDVGGVRHGHHRGTEFATDRDHVVPAGDRDGQNRGHRGVHVEPIQVHILEVVFVREHSDGIHVAHVEMHRHIASRD
jgi:hypothetical protein